jgi:hypothetical protein
MPEIEIIEVRTRAGLEQEFAIRRAVFLEEQSVSQAHAMGPHARGAGGDNLLWEMRALSSRWALNSRIPFWL